MDALSKVLVVDDSVGMRLITKFALGIYPDCEILEASTGVEALEILDSTQPDLIVVDIVMPEMDGLELLRRVRRRWSASDLPVIVVSTEDSPEDVTAAMEAGATACLPKPLQPRALQQLIAGMLDPGAADE